MVRPSTGIEACKALRVHPEADIQVLHQGVGRMEFAHGDMFSLVNGMGSQR
jgi:hypothetical protein